MASPSLASRTAIAEWVSELREAAQIERFNPDGTPMTEAPAEDEPAAAEETEDEAGGEDEAEAAE